MMSLEECQIGRRKCFLTICSQSRYLLIQPMDDHDLADISTELETIKQVRIPFTFCAFQVQDWFTDLSPWNAPPVFGHQAFGNGAVNTLSFIENSLLPELNSMMPDGQPVLPLIGGYSLAGLFALYAAYESKRFTGCAAISPSVWFPGWDRYMETGIFGARFAYLSLGDREEKTRNHQMATVGDRLRRQLECLENLPDVQSVLEWNKGNHFCDAGIRTGRGFAWLLRMIHTSTQEGIRK